MAEKKCIVVRTEEIEKTGGRLEELRILLIGNTGDGKSATGNTILGKKAFKSVSHPSSVTSACQFEYGERFGRNLVVVDSPGLGDTDLSDRFIQMELMRSLGYTYPGFHIIAYVLSSDRRFTDECKRTKKLFFEWFGSNVEKHAIIILTHWKDATRDPIEYCNGQDDLRAFRETCGNRVVALDNGGSEADKEARVKELFEVIDKVNRENKYSFSARPFYG